MGAGPSTSTGSAKSWRASTSASPPACSPPSSAATRSASAARRSSRQQWLTRIADEGLLMAYGATEPAAGSDLAALRTTAERVESDGEVVGYKHQRRASSGSATAASPTSTRILANAPGGPSWFVVEKGTAGLSARQAGGQARHPRQQHRGAVARGRLRRRRPAGRRRRGPGAAAGAGGVRLHAPDGRRLRPRRRLGGARPRHPVLDRAHPGRRPAVREAGLHAQADRPARRAARGGARLHRGDRGAHRRRRGRARTPRARSPSTSPPRPATPRRGRHPGARRLRLHARSTWSRRSSATCASPRSTRAPRRSWR